MCTGITGHGGALITAIVVLTGAAILHGGVATADPDQDQKFLTLLADNDIPAVDNEAGLIETANKACAKLDDGMPVGDLVELMRNNGFAANPLARLYPQGRVTRTIDRFITAAVQAYCPYDQSKIASIMAGPATGSNEPTYPGAVYTHNAANVPVVWQAHVAHPGVLLASRYRSETDGHGPVFASVIGTIPSGEIQPSNPLPAPVQPPPPPQQVQAIPEQPPPAPRQVPPPPQHPQPPPQQVQPAPREAEPPPPQEEPPPPEAVPSPQQAEPPPPEAGPSPQQAEPPAPPTEPPPAPPHGPGFVRLAP
jgi:Protein of unknown function (DUF732)